MIVVAAVTTAAALVLPTLQVRSGSVDDPFDLRPFAGGRTLDHLAG